MFKKTLLATATTAALLGPVAAFAVGEMGQGTINFSGTVIDAPCSISAADANLAIDLGQITKKEMTGANKFSASVPIEIHLMGCTFDKDTAATGANPNGLMSKVGVSFTGAIQTANQGLLTNTGTATGVGVQLMGPNHITPIDLGAAPTKASATQLLAGDGNTLSFFARLFAPAAGATTGTVKSSVTYTLTYF